ncbi:MAG: carboxypeptidase regulatory-like domain-containing protein [Candidatus Rokubacteria bacterium]|nr:carboxypeptidase regulatory-like domain-containing protein [Candidatus Rokubacteria bacterium]
MALEDVLKSGSAMMRAVLILALAVALASGSLPSTSEAGGPWKAQIVDAETGRPVEGVVVLLVWLKMTRSLGGPSGKYHDAEEAVTGPDGRFEVGRRRTFTLNPFTYIQGPYVTVFKPGYGQWRVKDWDKKPPEWEELDAGEVLEKEGMMLELQPLRTREERMNFYRTFVWGYGTPPADKTKRLLDAIDAERAYLGFRN